MLAESRAFLPDHGYETGPHIRAYSASRIVRPADLAARSPQRPTMQGSLADGAALGTDLFRERSGEMATREGLPILTPNCGSFRVTLVRT
jgi:hypothetical protein